MTLTGRKLIMESYFETGKYIEILGKQISWYAILGFIGLIAALFLCVKRRRRFDIARGDVINLMAYSIIGIIAGSKLLALICMTPDIIKNFSHIQWNAHTVSVLMQSGFVFYASWGSSQPSIFIAGSSVFRLEASWNFRRLPYRCFIFSAGWAVLRQGAVTA